MDTEIIDATPGTSMSTFAEYLCMQAKQKNDEVKGRFNSAVVSAWPKSFARDVEEKIHIRMNLNYFEAKYND